MARRKIISIAPTWYVRLRLTAVVKWRLWRICKFENTRIQIENGDKFILDSDCALGNQERVGLDYKALPRDVKVGDVLLLNDGLIVLIVERIVGNEIHTVV